MTKNVRKIEPMQMLRTCIKYKDNDGKYIGDWEYILSVVPNIGDTITVNGKYIGDWEYILSVVPNIGDTITVNLNNGKVAYFKVHNRRFCYENWPDKQVILFCDITGIADIGKVI